MLVLIVDGSIQIIERIVEMLTELNKATSFYSAISYQEAITCFKKNKPSVVLLDGYLPQNQSFKLLREIKHTGYKTAIIVLSVSIDDFIKKQYMLHGADYVLDKYHEFEKIPIVINSITGSNKSQIL